MTELAQLAPYATGAAVYLLSVGWLHMWTRFWGWAASKPRAFDGADILADIEAYRKPRSRGIDYGVAFAQPGDTLRASRQHEFPGARYDPLSPRRPTEDSGTVKR